MHRTHNTLNDTIRRQSADVLNIHLSAAIDLYGQLKQAHWNVRGPGFMAAHELFDTIATEVSELADQIAERIGGLGGTAHGTVQMAAERSFLLRYPIEIADVQKHIFAVAAALAAFSQSVREAAIQTDALGDPATADLLTTASRSIDRSLWFVESHATVLPAEVPVTLPVEPFQPADTIQMAEGPPAAEAASGIPNDAPPAHPCPPVLDSERKDSIGNWASEGGAGGDVRR